MIEKTNLFARKVISEEGLIIVAIMSHGDEGSILGTDGMTVQEKTLLSIFSEGELAEKPKLFIFAPCRYLHRT
jgi:hypothetical protein